MAYTREVAGEAATAQLAASPYHEVRFMDHAQGSKAGASGEEVEVPELLGRLREAQTRISASIPVFVRIPMPSLDKPSASGEISPHDAIPLTRSEGVDRPLERQKRTGV